MNRLLIDKLYNKLLALLMDKISLFESFYLVFEHEKKAVVNSDIVRLNEICAQKSIFFDEIRNLGNQSSEILKEFSDFFSFSPVEMTIGRLCQFLDGDKSAKLFKYRLKLLELINIIKEQNQKNMALLEHSSSIKQQSLNQLNQLIASDPVYHKSGKIYCGKSRGSVLSGAV